MNNFYCCTRHIHICTCTVHCTCTYTKGSFRKDSKSFQNHLDYTPSSMLRLTIYDYRCKDDGLISDAILSSYTPRSIFSELTNPRQRKQDILSLNVFQRYLQVTYFWSNMPTFTAQSDIDLFGKYKRTTDVDV